MLAVGGIVGLSALAWIYFHPLLGLWLVALGTLTYCLPAYGVALLFLLVSADIARPLFGYISVCFSEIQFTVCLLACLATRATNIKHWDWRPLKWATPFAAAVTVSGLINIEWVKVLPHLLRISELMVAAFLSANIFQDEASRRPFRYALAAAAIFYPLCGAWQFGNTPRIYSFFSNPNQFAGYLNLPLPFLIVFFFTQPRKKTRLLWGYLAGLVFLAQLSSLSRAGILGTCLSTTTLWWLHYRQSLLHFFKAPLTITAVFLRRSGPVLGIHLLAVTFILTGLWAQTSVKLKVEQATEQMKKRIQGGLVGNIIDFRLPYYWLGAEMWKDRPILDLGPGEFEEAATRYWKLTESKNTTRNPGIVKRLVKIHTHSLYLQLAVEYGLLGLIAFLFFLFQFASNLIRHSSSWHLATVGLLIAYLVHNIFDVTFPSLGLETGFLLGISLIRNSYKPQPETRESSS